MFQLSEETWQAIRPIFERGYPREVVVAIYPDETWEELENVHPQPTRHFLLSDADNARLLLREPALFLHSHPDGLAEPSDHDTDAQVATGWTWGIVVVRGDAAGRVLGVQYPEIWGPGAPVLPWQGRTYLWGVRDCWTLVRDWLRAKGHQLPHAVPRVRRPGPHHTDPAPVNQFRHWPERLGFERVADRRDRRPDDVAVMCWNSPVPNHCAVYLGEARYLHQPDGALSTIWQALHEERMLERFAVTFWRLPG